MQCITHIFDNSNNIISSDNNTHGTRQDESGRLANVQQRDSPKHKAAEALRERANVQTGKELYLLASYQDNLIKEKTKLT